MGIVSERAEGLGSCEGEATPLGGGTLWKVGGGGLTEEWATRSPARFKGREGRDGGGGVHLRPHSLAAGH